MSKVFQLAAPTKYLEPIIKNMLYAPLNRMFKLKCNIKQCFIKELF